MVLHIPVRNTDTSVCSVLQIGRAHAWSLDTDPVESTPEAEVARHLHKSSFSVARVLSALGDEQAASGLGLWLVTAGATRVEEMDVVRLAQSPVLGLGRVIANEMPTVTLKMVDLSATPKEEEIEALFREMVLTPEGNTEEEVALRGRKRFARRLERVDTRKMWRDAQVEIPARGAAFHLESDESGIVDRLVFRRTELEPLGPGEVRIATRHTALNFRDAMLALGLLPDEALSGGLFKKQFGLECSGKIIEVGSHQQLLDNRGLYYRMFQSLRSSGEVG